MTHGETITRLIDGFARFRKHYYEDDRSLYESLVREGQRPKTLLIACVDSRVSPSTTLQAAPGEMLVVRNVANLVPPAESDDHRHGTSAAIEFAVDVLGVEHVIVYGHSFCGGIAALLNQTGGTYVGPWMRIAERAREEVLRDHASADPHAKARALERAAILVSLENLLTFDGVRRRVVRGDLRLHGWYFEMEEGALWVHRGESGRFERAV